MIAFLSSDKFDQCWNAFKVKILNQSIMHSPFFSTFSTLYNYFFPSWIVSIYIIGRETKNINCSRNNIFHVFFCPVHFAEVCIIFIKRFQVKIWSTNMNGFQQWIMKKCEKIRPPLIDLLKNEIKPSKATMSILI